VFGLIVEIPIDGDIKLIFRLPLYFVVYRKMVPFEMLIFFVYVSNDELLNGAYGVLM